MKRIFYIYLLILVPVFASCIKDLGNDVISEINEIEITGIEESYSVISRAETLTITPEIKGSMFDKDESNYEYEWFLCNNGISDVDHEHVTISRERNLNYEVTAEPSTFTLHFAILDKSTGLKWETSTSLKVVSPFVRGWYVLGDKTDGTVGIDFVSMIEGRDNDYIHNIFTNKKGLKGAEDINFTGTYYNDGAMTLWLTTADGGYKLEYTAAQSEFDVFDSPAKAEDMIFPTIPVQNPMKVTNVWPRPYGTGNTCLAAAGRILTTEHEIFSGNFYSWPDAYGNPVNCYQIGSSELFQPAPHVFYPKNSTYVSGVCFFDKTNKKFARPNTNIRYSFTYCVEQTGTGTPFHFDQTKYEAVRDMVYGENGYGNAGRCYALMNDTNNDYYIYWLKVPSAYGVTAEAAHSIDKTVATEFDQATNYAFYSMQPILLYSVGAKLYAYDYIRKECKLVNTFDNDVTYLAFDFDTNNDPNHYLVATYGNGKGKLYGYTVEDNQNAINIAPAEGEEYETDIKIVKVEYRNATN